MEEIILKVTEWPVIIQGALGSGLFWLLLLLGTKITDFITDKIGNFTKQASIDNKRAEVIRYRALESDDPALASLGVISLIYGTFHFVVKALIMVIFGLIFQPIIYIFGIVAYVVALYFLFRAYHTVKDMDDTDSLERITQLEEEIENYNSKKT